MTRKYTDGAKALIGSLIAAGILALAAIIVLIISLVEPSPRKITFNIPEFIPEEIEKNCNFKRPLATTTVDGLPEWLQASTVDMICIKNKSEGFWIIYPFEPLSNDPA